MLSCTSSRRRQWFALPLAIAQLAVCGQLVRADVLVAVAIATGQPWGQNRSRATRRWIRHRTGLDDRTIRTSLRGSLAGFVIEDTRGAFEFRGLREASYRFVRVTWQDMLALRGRRKDGRWHRPVFDAVRLAAWTWIQLCGVRPWRRILWSPVEVAQALGWTSQQAGRALRAMESSGERIGAAAAGLVDLVDGWIWSRVPRVGSTDPAACGKGGGKASGSTVDPRSVRSGRRGIPRTQAEDLYLHTDHGKILLVDLASRFAVARAKTQGRDDGAAESSSPDPWRRCRPDRVSARTVRAAVRTLIRAEGWWALLVAFDRYLDNRRRYGRGRGWALSVLRDVFDAAVGGFAPGREDGRPVAGLAAGRAPP